MPIYCYSCPEHGEHDVFRSFAEVNLPLACPTCGQAMTRVITAPNLRSMDPHQRKARETNERSCHEPKVQRRHACGHDHSDGSSCSSHAPAQKQGLKSYAGPRPWVIEHPRS